MAGYWPISFFLRVYGPKSVTEQAWSTKDLSYDAKDAKDSSMICLFSSRHSISLFLDSIDRKRLGNLWVDSESIFLHANAKLGGTRRAIPSGQDGSILTARVANHSTRFASSCPLIEPAISYKVIRTGLD